MYNNFRSLKNDYCGILCRRRKKRIYPIFTLLIMLAIAMFYLSYNVTHSWILRLQKHQSGYFDSKGMKVIVGHYMGGNKGGVLSSEIVNSNNYNPVPGAGENGKPVELSPSELIHAKELYVLHYYNLLVSDKISINRSLPDYRSDSCKSTAIPLDSLPSASVIIVFHNEAWSTLMRNVMSVIMRSPSSLLKEIILVDDASDRLYLGKELEDAIVKLPIVRLLRIKVRSGLVGARLLGAENATGDVLVFLDAHCEVTIGWLEPLLERAGSDDVFVCPHIDIISDDTLAYSKSAAAHWGAFSRSLHFRWLVPSKEIMMNRSENPSKPYATPAMAGGLFAVRRSLFWRLGGYDKGLLIWGGENLEMSWRAWQCGARVEITPCSRVGHIFRKHSPYNFPNGVGKVLSSNLARSAKVWMDDWADFVLKFNPHIAKVWDAQNVDDRVELRKRLKCKSFEWYLNNVWPQHFFPTKERWFGRIKNERGACLAFVPSSALGMGAPASGVKCGRDDEIERLLVYTPEGSIMGDEGQCLELGSNGRAIWKSCSTSEKQIWKQFGTKIKSHGGFCLTLTLGTNSSRYGDGDTIKARKCVSGAAQRWTFERVPWR